MGCEHRQQSDPLQLPKVPRLLLIADDPVARPLTAALSVAAGLQLHNRGRLAEARAALAAGAFDAILLAPTNLDPDTAAQVAEIRTAAPGLPLIVVLPAHDPGLTARLTTAGADLVLLPPLDAAALAATLLRLLPAPAAAPAAPAPVAAPSPQPPNAAPAGGGKTPSELEVLRDFSPVLGYSLDYRQLTQQFVLKLREVIGVARIAIFLETPAGPAAPEHAPPSEHLTCAAAAGVTRDLIDCVELTRRSGIGRHITRHAQVLRGDDPAAMDDPQARREFEVLGCQVALPVNDRERTIGAALIGGRVTGGAFTDAELRLVYHLLEELGLAIKNSWLHAQVAASQRLFSDVIGAVTSGCLAIGADLAVLHTNRAFLNFLRGGPGSGARVDFTELPRLLAAALHDLVERDRLAEPFFLTSDKTPGRSWRVSLVPFPNPERRLPQPALALVEDFTQIQSVQRAEIEASNSRLLALIAKRFAHEIRNALVPLTTHHQLLDTDYDSPGFRDSLKTALGRETGRIQRFTEQMLFLSQPAGPAEDLVPVATLIEQSCARAARALGLEPWLVLEGDATAALVRVHRPGFAHALDEIFLNGLQAAPGAPMRVHLATDGGRLTLRFRDAGPGLTAEVAARAAEPFFTTRATGVGLGLTVARRIVEQHAGRLEVRARSGPDDADVVLDLPLC